MQRPQSIRSLADEKDPLVGGLVNGKFKILGVVANGGMGRIYRAEQQPLGRQVAIKVLHAQYTASDNDPSFQRRFFLEASILSRLQHPNIVTLYDYGRIEGIDEESYFMAMEFLAGETLHRRLKTRGPMAVVDAFAVCRPIARGLREAHRQGVVHRDLKPSNVMLVREDDGVEGLKILDFGLVKVLSDESEELTKEGSFLGSPRYMSPEQIQHGKVDHRTDLYSLGVIMYQCLCGRAPFENDNSVQTLMAHLHSPVPTFRERNPGVEVPDVVEALVRRCLEKDSALRPASMDEFLRALRECEVALGLAQGNLTPGTGNFAMGTGSFPPPVQPLVTHDTQPSVTTPSVEPTVASLPTPPPAVTSTAPAPVSAAPAPRAMPPWIPVLGFVAIVGIVALVFMLRPAPVANDPRPAPSQATHGAASEYDFVIESQPPGAQVHDGDAVVGTTPYHLLIQNDQVRAQPKRLTVTLDGYEPFVVLANPSSDRVVHVTAALRALAVEPSVAPSEAPVAQVLAHPPPNRPPPNRPPVVRPPAPSHAPPPDDIRIHR